MAHKWSASDILDNGKYGIVRENGEIVVGWWSGLTLEDAQKIAAVHNHEIEELKQWLADKAGMA